MKKSITSLLKGWCAALLCAGLTLPSFAAADADAAFAAQRHDLKLSLRNAPLREVVTAYTQQTGVSFPMKLRSANGPCPMWTSR